MSETRTISKSELNQVSARKRELEQKKLELKEGLPHLYKFPWYKWAWDFFKSTNHMNLLSAANQISKSSTQIRKAIEWSGNPSLWEKLWPTKPTQMWYLYPSREIFEMEYETKWLPEALPAWEYKNHPTYGWKELKYQGKRIGLQFNSGMILYFRTYSQDTSNLQAGSVYAIFCDEELPEEHYDELNMRMSSPSVNGYFHMVATPTLNQMMWRLAIEGEGEMEKWPSAFKQQISMYDCLTYMDGSPGAYTKEKIKLIKESCKSDTEIKRRVYGRFVTEVGRKYPQFVPQRHMVKPFRIPKDWTKYAAVDIGSGGTAHPPAIVFVAIRPDFRFGAVYRGWIGDDGDNYTSGDIYQKFRNLRGKETLVEQRYDQQARDFRTITDRAGDTFLGSDKRHERGEDVVNSLFKNDMLVIFEEDSLPKLGGELLSLMRDTPKTSAKDDYCDALRYCTVTMPWDMTVLYGKKTLEALEEERVKPYTEEEFRAMEIERRRGNFLDPRKPLPDAQWDGLNDEFAEWNERYIL